jgi:hypothetical protein
VSRFRTRASAALYEHIAPWACDDLCGAREGHHTAPCRKRRAFVRHMLRRVEAEARG